MAVEFQRQHFNAIAKLFRENFPENYAVDEMVSPAANVKPALQREMWVYLVLKFAKYFKEGNEGFDPLMFLDACSPDVDRYPISELWEDYIV